MMLSISMVSFGGLGQWCGRPLAEWFPCVLQVELCLGLVCLHKALGDREQLTSRVHDDEHAHPEQLALTTGCDVYHVSSMCP